MKKYLYVICTVVLIVFVLIACAAPTVGSEVGSEVNSETSESSGGGETDKIIIGATLQDLSNEFIAMNKDAMLAKAAEYPDIEIQILDAEGDAQKQIQQVDTFVATGVDVICIGPRDANQLVPAVKNAIDAGIPVVTVSALLDEDVGQSVVTSVNQEGGEMLMTWVAEQLGGKGNIAIMRGPIGASAEIQRFEGFEKALAENPEMEVVFDQTANWSREEGMTLMENWLQTGTEIDALVCQNDEMALGALQAIKDAGKEEEILVVGMDGILDAFNAIKDGEMDATCLQSAIGQGYKSVEIAYEAAKGAEPVLYDVGWELVTPENVEEMYNQISLDTYVE